MQPAQAQAQGQIPSPAASSQATVTIPAGTRIPLALASQITNKMKAGSAVRAVTGFPVTVGTQLAIPAGAYVEGVIDQVTRGGRTGPSVQMHFTRIIYPNGYSVAVDGNNTQAELIGPGPGSAMADAFAGESQWESELTKAREALWEELANANYRAPFGLFAFAQFPPVPPVPPLQKPPSHLGVLLGVAVGGTAAMVALLVLAAHHNGGSSAVLFDTGWQFEMALQSPLTVDTA
ncbi:MAG: hypothetical protein WBD66_00670, partial [Candidatus Acidiferrales bacterium]